MVKLIQLKYFVSTVEAGSVTTAARNLFISQPALSKQITQLENELNCELFLRKTTGIELTEAGKHLYQKGIELLKAAEELSSEMNQYAKKQTIKIGALPSIGTHFLPAVVNRLREEYKIEVLIKDTTEELVRLVENNQADFVFAQDVVSNRNFVMENICWEPYDAILPMSVISRGVSPLSITEFVENQLIIHKHPCDIRSFFEYFCKKNKIDYELGIELETNESIVAFVSSGLGASIMPRMVSRNVKDQSALIMEFADKQIGRSIDLLYKPSSKKLAKTIIAFSKESIFER
ncbi:LysR family transcriptional regulator [Neobacillus sp. PS2-9]|uniref:LysR family transcriptional regulator n=1 Tax=Neobacillus sp. PS2-9 TaxID=3070676 RepID=UPI0027DF08DA|nr:LysR family transcriptional regulator [Neobacillus sp. PS2-9]WML56269.1 LysR family transcriptional regulator [Neobacillus sp. PS2-9]